MPKPTVLRLGEDIKYNHSFYENEFLKRFEVIPNTAQNREEFIRALRTKKYGEFSAIFRPHFQTGGEMGQWDEELITLLPQSCMIFASAGAGFNWADVDTLGRHGIWYANGAGASDEAVSDMALYMLLSVFRNLTRAQLAARTADPDQFSRAHRLIGGISHNPRGHVLGIVGLGRISKLFCLKAKALGVRLVYHDIARQDGGEEKRLDIGWKSSLKDLLEVCDCVSLHVPLNSGTRHLINSESLSWMKNGSRLINTSRGEVVEEESLVQALRSGKLSAAGLDVHYHEPQVNKELAAMENVTLTVHCGGGAIETRMNFELNAMQNVLNVVGSGGEYIGPPLTPVNAHSYVPSGKCR